MISEEEARKKMRDHLLLAETAQKLELEHALDAATEPGEEAA